MSAAPGHVEFLVEDASLAATLERIVPRLVSAGAGFALPPYNGKDDLFKRLPAVLDGYRRVVPAYPVIVVVDADDAPCQTRKQRIEDIAAAAGVVSRAVCPADYRLVSRIAVRELEAWFLGDWDAVRAAYPGVRDTSSLRKRYRDPDRIAGPKGELHKALRRARCYAAGVPTVEVARRIATHMVPVRNSSASFRAFARAVRELAGTG
ncbi:MAG: DUF4276 family protein [Armatimonadetes bacterium]|nr:DUF4276 family protein [Armatimonadota bacterium]